MRLLPILAVLASGLLHLEPAAAQLPQLRTASEASGFVKTGRYDEVIRLCEAFVQAYPEQVRCSTFGTTPEGRPMQVLIVSQSGVHDPQQAAERKLPVTLVQGGIHAGEIDGKDAGFLLLRELLGGEVRGGKALLEKQVLLFVPVFNVDGHERFGRWNRPNQRGPEEMGWRTTAQNLNLNRDYAKADAPEMRALLNLVNQWDPLLYVDLHVTNGAQFEHDVSVQVEPLHAGDAALRQAGRDLRDAVLAQLSDQGSLPLPFYPAFDVNEDPASGITDVVAPPRFSTGYFLLRNRFGVLVETHAWKDYATRVRTTRNTVLNLLDQVARHGHNWRREALAADRRAAAFDGADVALDYRADPQQERVVDFRGYAYTRRPSAISGALVTRYDEKRPQIWKMPVRDVVQPTLSVAAPRGGYVIPAAWAERLVPRLAAHGIEVVKLTSAQPALAAEAFKADSVQLDARSTEGRQRLTVTGKWSESTHAVAAGALFVPIAQPKARLVMALLEPQAPDSALAWGDFNNAFEQKEYMEAYVAEDVAKAMLAADPALATEFIGKLAQDPAFAANPAARLAFFAQRHSSHDQRLNWYPVLRVARLP